MSQDADGSSYSADDERIIKIPLNNDRLDQSVLAAKRATTQFQGASKYDQDKFAVAASMVYTPADGEAQRLRIVTRSKRDTSGTNDARSEHWLYVNSSNGCFMLTACRHIQTHCIDFDAFEVRFYP